MAVRSPDSLIEPARKRARKTALRNGCGRRQADLAGGQPSRTGEPAIIPLCTREETITEDRTLTEASGTRPRSASWLHFWRFVTHPNRFASIIPSSRTLSRLVADQVCRFKGEYVVELGAGTGVVTRALLASGIPANKLIAVEIDAQMARFLRDTYPDVSVIEGDALNLGKILPPSVIGNVGTVVCGIPASLLPLEQERELVTAIFSLMPAGRRLLAYSYRLASPLPEEKLGLLGERLVFTLRNIPPVSVWGYVPQASIPDQLSKRQRETSGLPDRSSP